MKAILLDDIVRDAKSDLELLDRLLLSAEGLRSPARPIVQAMLMQQIGCCVIAKRRWESRTIEVQDPPVAAPAGAREQDTA